MVGESSTHSFNRLLTPKPKWYNVWGRFKYWRAKKRFIEYNKAKEELIQWMLSLSYRDIGMLEKAYKFGDEQTIGYIQNLKRVKEH